MKFFFINDRHKIFISRFLNFLGMNPSVFLKNISGLKWYFKDLSEIQKQLSKQDDFFISSYYPILSERKIESGYINSHYFWQDFYVARRIFENNPLKHVDIGSRIDGFVTHVASYREIELFDLRPLESHIENVTFIQFDFSDEVSVIQDYCDSLSCLHVIEHFGLGRYGDKIDINAHIKGLNNIKKILKKGGRFYFSVPIGPQRIEFNAHRIFSIDYLIKILSQDYIIDKLSIIDDKAKLHIDVKLSSDLLNSNFNCTYGCGIFELIKK
jgi:SAM-dependent methyltransferase